MRERIAARGIRAEEIDWFKREMKPSERQTLKLVSARDPLLADAYRETLASRLTATRIVRSSKRELLLMQRRQNKLKYYKTESAKRFLDEIENDVAKIKSINEEAKEMLAEAEARMQMIDVASVRGSSIADSELALKKLSARASELPLALESAKMADDIRSELEKDDTLTDESKKDRSRALNSSGFGSPSNRKHRRRFDRHVRHPGFACTLFRILARRQAAIRLADKCLPRSRL